MEKSHKNATDVSTCTPLEDTFEHTQWRNVWSGGQIGKLVHLELDYNGLHPPSNYITTLSPSHGEDFKISFFTPSPFAILS